MTSQHSLLLQTMLRFRSKIGPSGRRCLIPSPTIIYQHLIIPTSWDTSLLALVLLKGTFVLCSTAVVASNVRLNPILTIDPYPFLVDIYDGDEGPMIYHGKTFTSKVSLNDICQAINKYAFMASPYPLLISAEVHCGVKQQDQLVDIMSDVFGDALVQAPVEGRPKIEVLPSPEDLKNKVLLKVR